MYFGNIYPFLTEEEVKNALLRQINSYNLLFLLPVFNEAWDSRFWIKYGYDGATGIEDKEHPSIEIFLHDYGYRVYGGNLKDDYIMYKLQKLMNKKTAFRNYLGTTIIGFIFKAKNRILKGKKNNSTEKIKELYNLLRRI
jgi:hypothetical protein